MRRPFLVHVYGQEWVLGDQMATYPGVVEVYVGEKEVTEIGYRHPVVGQPLTEGVERCAGAGVHQRGLGLVDQVRRDRSRKPEVVQVDRRDAQPRSSIGTKSRSSVPT